MNPATSVSPDRLGQRAKWTVERHPRLVSTQTRARECPAWTAIVADEQSAGRGQADRTFVSDSGGLYLSAVLPYAGDPLKARGFALAVGWAVRAVLRRAGVRDARLRWPNDLMVGARKIGGILVEQGQRDTLCVGLGLNLTNRPWRADPALADIAGRLADHCAADALGDRARLIGRLLRAIRAAHVAFGRKRLEGFVPILNRCWGEPRRVVLELAPGVGAPAASGFFAGIAADGCVLLRQADGTTLAVPEHHIRRLREVG